MRIRLILLSCVLLFGCTMTSTARDKEKALYHLQIGTGHLNNGNYPSALREILEADRLDPKNPVIKNNLGLAYLVRDKLDLAEHSFLNALAINPNYVEARNNLGLLYVRVGMHEKAIHHLKIATNDLVYPEPEKSWSNLGQAYFLKGDYANAKEALLKSLRSRRDSCYTLNLYGRTLFELKSYKEASESLDQAIRLCEKSKFDEPHFFSGLSYYKLGNNEVARTRMDELLQLHPQSRYASKAKEVLETLR